MLLSELLGATLKDARGRVIGRLGDVVARVQGGEGEPAPVAGLLVRRRGGEVFLPMAAVAELSPRTATVRGNPPDLTPFARRPHEALLGRDVMDSQVISLREPRVVRVNDVALTWDGDAWRVTGVDVGVGALARRLLPRALRRGDGRAHIIPWTGIELLSSEVPGGLLRPDHRRLARLHPADIARVADAVPRQQATEIVASLDDELAADTMEEMIDAKQADVIEELEPERAADILDRMAPDAAADVLAELEPEVVDTVLRRMDPAEAGDVHALLTYPRNTAGGLMSTDYVMAPSGLRVGAALDYLRPQLAKPDLVYYVYVVDDERERRLRGVFSLRHLLLADPERLIDDIMVTALRRAAPDTPAPFVARTMSEYNLMALPVTDAQGRLLGIVSVDDALEVILPAELRRRIPRIFS